MIETRLLHYFLAVAREQNITRAAEALHVTQSTLSKQMMDLERQLGKQLLIRGNRSVTLTEEGIFLRKPGPGNYGVDGQDGIRLSRRG